MPPLSTDARALRLYRNSRLYRSVGRVLRAYNRYLVEELHRRGFTDFSPAFPALLSNLDTGGSHIGVLAQRAGVTRQAASQLLREIERCDYVALEASPYDARATMVRFTARGRKLLQTVLELVGRIDHDFAAQLKPGEFERARQALFEIAERIDPDGALTDEDTADPGHDRRQAARTLRKE